jgi:hypothetical protein
MAAAYNMPGVAVVATLLGPPSFALDLVPSNCLKQQLYAELNLSGVRYDPQRERLRNFFIAEQYDSVLALVSARNIEHLLDSVRIPVIQALGWADVIFPANSAIRAIQRLTTRAVPVRSYFGTNGHSEPVHLGESFFVLAFMTSGFDHWLKGSPLDHAGDPVVVYADDRQGWPHHETIGWPPEPRSSLRLFLSAGTLRTTYPNVAFEAPFILQYNPSYSTTQGWDEAYGGPAFRAAFRSTTARLLSNPLADTLDVTGVPQAHIQVKSGGPRFQAHVRLFDVAPAESGYVWSLMTRGANGVRNYVPGTVVARDVELQALSHRIPPGHRVGVEVTSLDMYDTTRAHIIPYFVTTASALVSSAFAPSYIDLPLVGSAVFTSAGPLAATVPSSVVLYQNYPNPFNPTTVVSGEWPVASDVKLAVYDMLGREVAILANGRYPAGRHEFTFDASLPDRQARSGAGQAGRLASGVYFCRLTVGTAVQTVKMTLMR